MITKKTKIEQILSYQIIQLKKNMLDNSLQINIGKQIQKIRELKGISQQDLAAKCNFEKSNMSRLEAGRVNPTLSTLEKIVNALDITLAELFTFN